MIVARVSWDLKGSCLWKFWNELFVVVFISLTGFVRPVSLLQVVLTTFIFDSGFILALVLASSQPSQFFARIYYSVVRKWLLDNLANYFVLVFTLFTFSWKLNSYIFLLFSLEGWSQVVKWFGKVVQGIRVNILC